MAEQKKHTGKLLVVSSTAGIKVEGIDGWLNPDSKVKEAYETMVDTLREWKGKQITVHLNASGRYELLEPIDDSVPAEPQKQKEADKPVQTENASQNQPALATAHKQAKPVDKNKPESYFSKLAAIECTAKKTYAGKNYLSWADAWETLKREHPEARYIVEQDPHTGMPYYKDNNCGFVKVTVVVSDIAHTIFMPILDNTHKPVKVEDINSFNANTAIMRGLAKAIALHGLGLYLYRGEDLPDA